MKKLMFLMMALLVAPAMATVTISVVDNGNGTADIVAVADGTDLNGNLDSLVAGFGLDLSVDVGTIDAVTNFMATGESVDGAEGYGIFMGTILFTGDPVDGIDLANVDYSPVAPADAPDLPGQLGTSAIVVELGCLFNVNTPEGAPLATTTLCTIGVSEEATLTLGENATRGGVVLIGGGAPSGVVLESGLVTIDVCYPGAPGDPAYDEWVDAGKPDCWCWPRQCHGDADGYKQGTSVFGFRWVDTDDLDVLIDAWQIEQTPHGVGVTPAQACADFDHLRQGTSVFGFRRVDTDDLDILIASWQIEEPGHGVGIPADCVPGSVEAPGGP